LRPRNTSRLLGEQDIVSEEHILYM
jgi:hypothetical protein